MKFLGPKEEASPGLKRFWSQGKEVSIELPAHWKGKREDDDMRFFEPANKGCALRLSVWVFPCGDDPLNSPLLTPYLKQQGGEMEQLGPAHWLYRFRVGPASSFYHLRIRGAELCLAIFALTDFAPEVEELLERQIRAMRFQG